MSWRRARLGFFGRRLVGLMLDGSHHGKCEHDERDVTMPAMPRYWICFLWSSPNSFLASLKAAARSPPRGGLLDA